VLVVRFYVAEWAGLFATGAAEINTSRPVFVNQGFGQVYESSLLSLKFGLGTELIF
jgi:hypothetical protein